VAGNALRAETRPAGRLPAPAVAACAEFIGYDRQCATCALQVSAALLLTRDYGFLRGSAILVSWMTASKAAFADPDRDKKRQARKAQRHSERRLLIMHSARDLLVDRGIEHFTVADVAQVSQLSKPAVYYYFDSKEALVFDLAIESLQAEFNILSESVHAAKSGVESLVDLIRTRVDFFLNDMNAYRVLHVWAPAMGLQRRLSQSNTSKQISALLNLISHRLSTERTSASRAVRLDAQQLPQMAWALSQGILGQFASGAQQPRDLEQCRATRDVACRWLLDSLVT
jgi:AcrR family transcriptional regulator